MSCKGNGIATVHILRAVSDALPRLDPPLRAWLQLHVVVPRAIEVCTDRDLGTYATFWLVTDHIALNDAPLRIVFHGNGFGLELKLEDGVSYLVHRAASLAAAVECL